MACDLLLARGVLGHSLPLACLGATFCVVAACQSLALGALLLLNPSLGFGCGLWLQPALPFASWWHTAVTPITLTLLCCLTWLADRCITGAIQQHLALGSPAWPLGGAWVCILGLGLGCRHPSLCSPCKEGRTLAGWLNLLLITAVSKIDHLCMPWGMHGGKQRPQVRMLHAATLCTGTLCPAS